MKFQSEGLLSRGLNIYVGTKMTPFSVLNKSEIDTAKKIYDYILVHIGVNAPAVKEKKEAALEKGMAELKEKAAAWDSKLREQLKRYEFEKSSEHLCHDAELRQKVTIPGTDFSDFAIVPIWSKGLLMDDHNRQMCFA